MNDARAYIAAGGNVGDRHRTLEAAIRAFDDGTVADTQLLACSRVYETRPVGPSTEPFLNAVVEVRCGRDPVSLMDALLGLERAHGRTRTQKWAARTLDLDLIAFVPDPQGDASDWQPLALETAGLVLPHPAAWQRDFVLAPLADVAPRLPLHRGLAPPVLLAQIPASERTVLHSFPAPWP